jgi:hypothetical protein
MEEDLTTLMASIAAGRRYWVRAPQDTARPYVILNVIDTPRGYTMKRQDGLIQSRVQADVYADSYSSAKSVARSINALLSGYRGGKFQGVFVDSERDLPAETAGSVTPLFRISLDLMIHYGELP